MRAFDSSLKLGVKLQQALAWIGVYASSEGTPSGQEAAQICAKMAARAGDLELNVEVSVIHLLCQLCDALRERNETAMVAEAERIVALLKGDRQRVITSTMNWGHVRNIGELDDKLEAFHKLVQGNFSK